MGYFGVSESFFGRFDQGGNVWGWNEFMPDRSFRGLRGGSFCSRESYLHAAHLSFIVPPVEGLRAGFRVAEVSEPATTAILAWGSLVAVHRRRW